MVFEGVTEVLLPGSTVLPENIEQCFQDGIDIN